MLMLISGSFPTPLTLDLFPTLAPMVFFERIESRVAGGLVEWVRREAV